MPSTINADTGAITGTTGIVQTADGSGELALQANGNTVVTISTNRLANFAGNVSAGNVTIAGAGSFGGNVSAGNVSVTGVVRFNDGTSMNTAASGGGGLTWQAVVTSNTTVSSGNAYPVSTVSQPVVITLPSSPGAGNAVQLVDYARTWSSNAVTLNRNGSNIAGAAANATLTISGSSVALVYIDAAQGWTAYDGLVGSPVSNYSVEYLIVAGGGGAAVYGGGGAGGMLTGSLNVVPGTAYSITVGSGGASGSSGVNSTALGITTVGGGGGSASQYTARSGGSGAGNSYGSQYGSPGAGTAGQGNAGGQGADGVSQFTGGGGGGGAGQAGANSGGASGPGGAGGNGLASSISGSSITYAGGGGGAHNGGSQGSGGSGGGGNGSYPGTGTNGTANLGGGGGGNGGQGGSGIVIIRYLGGQRASGGTVTSANGYTIHTFTSSGTFTA